MLDDAEPLADLDLNAGFFFDLTGDGGFEGFLFLLFAAAALVWLVLWWWALIWQRAWLLAVENL